MRAGILAVAWLAAQSAGTASQGARLLAVVPEGGGKARAQLEVDDAALQKDFASGIALDRLRAAVGSGGARPSRVTGVVADQEPVETVLAFDQSGSFARFWPEAFELAKAAFASALDTPHRQARVVTFGLRTDASAPVSSSATLTALLTATQGHRANQKATRLKAAILDAARLASSDVPLTSRGLREVVVFTDGGEESDAYHADDLIKQLSALGVRVHVVCFYRGAPGQGHLASRLDQMKRLAEGSGGTYVQVDDHATAQAALAGIAASVAQVYWVELGFCGVPGARPVFDDRLSLEVLSNGARSAWTDGMAFVQHAEGDALHDCPSAPSPTLPMTATAPPPHPQPSTPAPTVETPQAAAPKLEVPVESSSFPWLWLLLGLVALMALIYFVRRGQDEPVEASPPAPASAPTAVPTPPPAVEAPAAAPAPAPAWSDPLATLPETRLVVVRGPPNLEPAYRIHKRELTMGGAAGADVDVVVPLPQLSARHATFQLYPTGALFVMDLRSTNGTFVDGRRLGPGERVQLRAGQTIQLSQQLELKLEQPGQELSPPIGAGAVASSPGSATAEEAPRVKAKTVYSPLTPRDDE